MLAVHRAPVPDPLTRPPQQRQQRPVPLRAGRVDQPDRDLGLDPSRQPPRNALAILAAAAAAHHITTRHPMRPVHRRAPDRHRTRPHHPTPRTRDHGRAGRGTQRTTPTRTAGDSPSAAGARARGHPRSPSLNATTYSPIDPPIDIDQPDPAQIDPAQEMRQPQRVRPLRIRPTATARQPPQELARLARPDTRPDHHEPRAGPARRTQIHLNRERSRHANQPLPRR